MKFPLVSDAHTTHYMSKLFKLYSVFLSAYFFNAIMIFFQMSFFNHDYFFQCTTTCYLCREGFQNRSCPEIPTSTQNSFLIILEKKMHWRRNCLNLNCQSLLSLVLLLRNCFIRIKSNQLF